MYTYVGFPTHNTASYSRHYYSIMEGWSEVNCDGFLMLVSRLRRWKRSVQAVAGSSAELSTDRQDVCYGSGRSSGDALPSLTSVPQAELWTTSR